MMNLFCKQTTWTVVLLVLAANGVVADECDPGLTGSPASPAAYRQRGDRCEGIYALQVNSTQIRLASMVEAFAYDPEDPQALQVTWARPAGDYGPVRLRAQSLQPNSYYRMDTTVGAGRTAYEWPSDVLASLKLPASTVGVLAWTRLAGEERDVYLPLRVSQGKAPAGGGEYQVAVVPDHRLREIHVTLTPLDAAGALRPPVFERELGYGLYMAKEATVFSFARPDGGGIYQVDIACEIWSGGSMTTSFTFYQSEDS